MRCLPAAAILIAAACAALPLALTAYSGGPPNRRTGAPGERTCLDANCHVGPRLEASSALALDTGEGFRYTPGGPAQRWNVRIDDAGARAFGLQMTVRSARDLERQGSGDLTPAEDRMSSICDNEEIRGDRPCPAGHSVQFLHHTEPRRAGQFVLHWTPPAAPEDAAVYLAANASVSGQRNSRIHLRSYILRPRDGGSVVNGASLAEGISDGAWMTIFGQGFGGAGELAVRVNGRTAAIGFASDAQINALVPVGDDSVGPVPVEVLRGSERRVLRLAMKQRWAPGLFSSFRRSNGVPVDGTVRPGDELTLYGTGFAPDIALTVGGRDIAVRQRRDLAPGVAAFDVTVPDLPDGEAAVMARSGGYETPATLRLHIARE